MARTRRPTRWKPAMVVIVALMACGLAGTSTLWHAETTFAATPAASPVAVSADETIEFTGLIAHPGPVSVSDLQSLPSETVEVTYEAGGTPTAHTYTGVRLIDVLGALGMTGDPATHNPLLRRYLVVTARDGYQIVLSGGEIDPNFGNTPVLLAWAEEGAPLPADEGPLRLVVPGDLRGGRYIYGIVSIDVRSIDAAS